MVQVLKQRFFKVHMEQTQSIREHKVSAVIITYNESLNIKRTLPQLYWCDEIIIVDSFSTDETLSIARQYGCKVFQRIFRGFGDQKAFAIAQSKNDWVLCLDADEYLTDGLIKEITNELVSPGDIHAFALPSNLVFRGQRFKYGRECDRYVVRLFNRRYGHMSHDRVHEGIKVKGNLKKLHGQLIHYSYHDITQYFTKFDRYTAWCAEMYFQKGKRKSKAWIAIAIPYYFFKYYLLERNILNGMNGLYWSALMSVYHFVKYIKLEDMYEMRKSLADGRQINAGRH